MIKKCGFLMLLPVAMAACKAPKDLVYKNIEHFKIGQSPAKRTIISMNVLVYNPNHYKLKLKQATADVYLNGSHLGKMTLDGRYVLPGRDTSSLPVQLEANVANALPNMVQLFTHSDVLLTLAGSVKAGRYGLYVTLPLKYEGRQDIKSGIKW